MLRTPRCRSRLSRLLAAAALCLSLWAGDEATAGAYTRDYYFESIGAEAGLAQHTVYAIHRDAQGFMWFGTSGALHRWDGYHLRRYLRDPTHADSLPGIGALAVADADDGRLWVATREGQLALFDPVANRTLPLPAALSNAVGFTKSLSGGGALPLLIGSSRGIAMLTPHSLAVQILWRPPAGSFSFPLNGFSRCGDGRVYALAGDQLLALDLQRHRVQPLPLDAALKPLSLLCDSAGGLLIGTSEGVYLQPQHGAPQRIWPRGAAVATTPSVAVRALAEDADHRLWLAVDGTGLVRLDPDGSTRVLTVQPGLPGTLPEADIDTLYVDPAGLLWIGTDTRGVVYTRTTGSTFRWLFDRHAGADPANENDINAVAEDAQGMLWLGLRSGGLRRYDRETGTFTDAGKALNVALGRPAEGPEPDVTAIITAADGTLWLGTKHVLLHFDPAHDRAQLVTPPGIAGGTFTTPLRTLLRTRDGALWIGTLGQGVLRWVPGQKVSQWMTSGGIIAGGNRIYSLVEDHAGRVWIASGNGLLLWRPGTTTLQRFGLRDGLSDVAVATVHASRDGNLWVGTASGLDRLLGVNAHGARFARMAASAQLPDSTIYCAQEGGDGGLWVSTNLGIARLGLAHGDVRAFGIADGIQGMEYNVNVCLRRADGTLIFGGLRGLDEVRPGALGRDRYQPPVRITAIRVGSAAEVLPGISGTLAMPQQAGVVRFDFAALDYAAPQRNRFMYRLLGFDRDWVDAGSRHEATYTNLGAGSYRFEVRGSNHDGVFSPQIATLALRVTPPWWNAPAMRALYAALIGLLALGIAAAIWNRRRAELRHRNELREREDRLRLSLWGSGDEFWEWDMRRGLVHRMSTDHLLGGHREETLSLDDWRNFAVHPDDLQRVEQALAVHVEGGSDHFESEYRLLNAQGEWTWVLARGKVVDRDAHGHALRLAGTARDIHASREAERDRRIAAEVIRSMGEAVTVTDLQLRFVSVNPAFTRITGYHEDETIGRDAAILNCGQHPPEMYERIRRSVFEDGHWHGELWQRRKDGEEFLCWVELNEVRDAQGVRTHFVGVLSDITERKRVEQELRYLANYDTLTGLPNRTLLGERLGHAILRARRGGRRVAVLFLDLDRFKHVNDSLGHATGDRMLKVVGARLRQTAREEDTVARLGGDEFTVVLEGVAGVRDAEDAARKILESFVLPLELDSGQEILISPSIGIALYPDHGQVPTDLLKFADTAMYQAKERGRNTFAVYTEAMDASARLRATMIGALRRALEHGELSLVYQPKLSLSDGRVTGVEALLRWQSGELGPIPPGVFIPLAEEVGLIGAIGEFVLERACADLHQWRTQGLTQLTMAVNLSAAQLVHGDLARRIGRMLAAHDIAPPLIELELTESMVMANAEQSVRILGELKAIGVTLAIDDFGTGYSSLAYLKRLPIDTLKIDKEFVGDITTDPDDEAITATVITMAHSLGLNVIAEGVESAEQLEYLREQGCDEVQGHLIAPPMPAEACLAMLRTRVDPALLPPGRAS
jgi:diguanylate cyclase (GGDEF)-like protein/PAS domain S-box-containing protein